MLIGRQAELDTLTEAVRAAAAGNSSAVVVSGEAGIGKTRLLREVRAQAIREGAETVGGGCIPLSQGVLPYAPVIAALRQGLGRLSPKELGDLPPTTRLELGRLLPELRVPDESPDFESDQIGLFDGVLDLLRLLATPTPLIFVLEDVHWSDASTRDLITYLLHATEDDRLLFLCTFRTGELDATHPVPAWIQDLAASRIAEVLELRPLSREETRRQISEITGGDVSDSIVGELCERSEGNPFFLEELVQTAIRGTEELPPSLRELLLSRIRALSAEAIEVVKAIAVGGPVVSHELLLAATGLDESAVGPPLENAIDHHLLVRTEDDGYSLRHALLRETVYARLLPGERKELHRSFAQALQRHSDEPGPRPPEPGRLARHWHEAGDPKRALPHALAAAADADKSYASSEALSHYQHALRLWNEIGDPEEVAGVTKSVMLHRAGGSAERNGDFEQAVGFYQEAIGLVDPASDPRQAATLRSALVNVFSGPYLDDDAALPLLREAQGLVKDLPESIEKAQVLSLTACNLSLAGNIDEGSAAAVKAMEIAERLGDRATTAGAHVALALALRGRGDPEPALEHLTTALDIARETQDGPLLGRVSAHLSETLFRLNRLEDAVTLALAATVESARLGDESFGGFLRGNAAEFLTALGHWDQAEELAVPLQDAPSPVDRFFSQWLLAQIDVERGRFEQARTRINVADRYMAHTKELRHQDPVAMSKISLALWEHRYEDASSLVQSAWTIGNEDQRSVARLCALGVRVEADRATHARAHKADAIERDAIERGTDMEDRCAAAAAGSKMPEVEGLRDLTAAEASRLKGHVEPVLWKRTVEGFDALRYGYHSAYARYRYGESLLAAGSRKKAEPVLREASRAALDLGAAPLGLEIGGLARRARLNLSSAIEPEEPTAAARPADHLGLTSRELEVLRSLGEGLTNKQIAEALYISPKTASIHVSRILTKLGVSSRVEAARRAYESGLLHPPDRTEA